MSGSVLVGAEGLQFKIRSCLVTRCCIISMKRHFIESIINCWLYSVECTQMRCVKLLNPKIMHIYFSTWILSLNIFLLHWIPLVPSPINCLSYQESQNVTMFLPMQLPCHLSNNPLPSNHFILTHLLSRFHHLYQLPTLWKQTKIYFIKH